MRAGGVISLFIWKTARAVPEEIYVCLFPSVSKKSKEEKGREGVHGVFFSAGFERKYLTEGSFVCFQMIDFGIWATPLAVQG